MKKHLFLLSTLFIMLSCSNRNDIIDNPTLTIYDEQVIEYFKEIALGFEGEGPSEITRKWTTDMIVFVDGNVSNAMQNELNKIISELNNISSDGFSISLATTQESSNFYIFLGSGQDYANLFPSEADAVITNWGLFRVFWNNNEIYSGRMYVDIERANEIEQKHLLREELTQALGLGKDSYQYPESIFQQEWTHTTEYATIDKDIIRLLYHPEMEIGLSGLQIDSLLRSILLSEK